MADTVGYKNINLIPTSDDLTTDNSDVMATSKAITNLNKRINSALTDTFISTQATIPTNVTGNAFTLPVTGVTDTNVVFVQPQLNYETAYTTAGIKCVGQSLNTLSFTYVTAPTAEIILNILILNKVS